MEFDPAQRYSRNWPGKTRKIKPSNPKKDVCRKSLIEIVSPNIRAKFSTATKNNLFKTNDNGRTQISVNDVKCVQKSKNLEWNIQLAWQPPDSPGFYVLYSAFNSMPSLQQIECSKNIVELENIMQKSFNGLSLHAPNKMLFSSQTALELKYSLSVYGGLDYNVLHSSSSSLNVSKMLNFTRSCG